jgi:hypothetical protein
LTILIRIDNLSGSFSRELSDHSYLLGEFTTNSILLSIAKICSNKV